MEKRSNKTIVTDFYKQVIGGRDLSQVDTYISDHYIQHSPMGKDGKAGIVEMLQFLKILPKPVQTKSPVTMVIGDGDFVAMQLDINFMGKRALVVDLFRVENGKIAEHWDVVQYILEDTINSLNRELHRPDDVATSANKALIKNFFNEVLIPKQFELASRYINEDSSNPQTSPISGWLKDLLLQATDYELKVYKLIGEGNLVLVQSSCRDAGSYLALNDIFELADGKIVSHWRVEQPIPDKMMHGNGML